MSELVERLRGDLRLSNGGLAPAHLVLDDDGLFIRDHSNESSEISIDVLEARPLAYVPGRFSDSIEVGDATYGVPAGRGERVQRMFAYARLGEPADIELPGREAFIEPASPVEVRWLRTWLEPDELLLAWLHLGRPTRVESSIGPSVDISPRFVLTPRRAALVAIGPLGDVKLVELPQTPLEIGEGTKRPIVAGEVQTLSSTSNGKAFARLAAAVGEAPERRAWLVARALRGEPTEPAVRLLAMLDRASGAVPEAAVIAALLRDRAEPPPMEALLEDADRILALWHEWQLTPERGQRLVRWAREAGEETAAAVQLHDHVHKARIAAADDDSTLTAIDLDYADHLAAASRWERATSILEARLGRLPSEELRDLVPPADADLTTGAGGQTMRIAILDRLATTRGDGDGRHASTLVELARLAPLVPRRLEELASAGGPIAARARHYRETVAQRRWTEPAPPVVCACTQELDKTSIDDRLTHPLARAGHALGALQGLLADVEVPDASALRNYCERLGAAREDATATVTDVTRGLGMKPVECFVSRGDKSLGLRSYEGDAPFVLIGCDHLDESSPDYLGPTELRFALAAELAHLRFGHSRVTSMDVWTGALSKTKAGFDAVVGFLPAWRLLKVAEKASSIAGYYDHAQWALSQVSRVAGWTPFTKAATGDRKLGADTDDLIAAARVMQLTADRAGLIFSGDLHASIRAICLLGADSDVLRRADDATLFEVLAARDDAGEIERQALAIRVAALISFYLSEDWDALRAEMTATNVEGDRTSQPHAGADEP